MNTVREYEDALQKCHDNPQDLELTKRLIALNQKMDILDAWSVEKEAKSILTQLNITDFKANLRTLSGGQKKRVAMASVLINPADLLILDEPTNHIDNDTVDWLEKFLSKRKGALLMVTHDRYFLERVANRIIELSAGRLNSYHANYSRYLEMKLEREELEQSVNLKKQNLIKSELEWLRKGAKARSTKQKARIDRFYKLQDENALVENSKVEIKVATSRLGRQIIELDNVSKSYDGLKVVHAFSYIFLRDDRVGIIGINGSGKSTLLRIIIGKLSADSGNVLVGATVKIGYFSQEIEEMDECLRVIEYIREGAEFIATSEGKISASQMLEKFLFPPSAQWTPISKLSGGEKRRLYLLRVLMSAPNVLLLDEPTNDLDIQTLSILEDYLEGFCGTVVVVSHDRFFLDRVTKKIFSFGENGNITQSAGNYSDYRERLLNESQLEENTKKTKQIKNINVQEIKKERPVKLTFKEQIEFQNIDIVIADLENELNGINVSINDASSDFELLQELLTKQQKLEACLNNQMERWVYLNEIVESFKSYS
jgi:ATP-binding cassette subfamily F protein uup